MTAETSDEASALVEEVFVLSSHRPKPPPPPGWRRFELIHRSVEGFGCFGLEGERPAPRLLVAVAVAVAVAELCADACLR
ncbi:hypothetical protein [Streptomyces sp. Wb2n-11]|uniref:hypothetical protein n=1 Tax=Streptomyces sp. Wb2n-11 TaxID=1030533 RepID=UPI000A41991A|nr:hypothetical protein [Streptomyces sp. Wb2n-11]